MKIEILKNYSFVTAIWSLFLPLLVGCAHYFSINENINGDVARVRINEYCIREDDGVNAPERLSPEHGRFGNFYDLMKKNYPDLKENCESNAAMKVVFSEKEVSEFGDLWMITAGVVPGVYYKRYEVKIDTDGRMFKKVVEGRNVISIFLIPFFYWNKNGYDIIFDSVSAYLKNNYLLQGPGFTSVNQNE